MNDENSADESNKTETFLCQECKQTYGMRCLGGHKETATGKEFICTDCLQSLRTMSNLSAAGMLGHFRP